MKILFLTPYPLGQSPSQRFRFEQYFNALQQRGHSVKIQSFLSIPHEQLFFEKGKILLKAWALISGFSRRISILVEIPSFDFVFIHREAAPLGPPLIEWMLRFVFRKKIIYDFDDAIWTTDRVDESFLVKMIKWRSKVASICTWAYKVSGGNEYLSAYASQFNNQVVYNPTTIDTLHWHNPDLISIKKNESIINIGWTGSHSTLVYLKEIEATLKKIEADYPQVNFIIIANKKPDLELHSLKFITWKKETEISDLLLFDIGIMPLPDDDWAKGKCGFKALQYMALKIPCVISPVGVNTKIVDQGANGFLAAQEDEWYQYITRLIKDKELRLKIGEQGRQKIIKHYSLISNTTSFLTLFE